MSQHVTLDSRLLFLDDVGEVALPTIVAVEVHCHKDTWSTGLMRAFASEACDLVVGIHLVELQHSKLHLLPLVLDLP